MIKEDTIQSIYDNNSTQNVTAEEAAEIYNNREQIIDAPSSYMGDYNRYKAERENSRLQLNKYLDYKGLAKSLADNNLYSILKDHQDEMKRKEDILAQKKFDESSFWNRLSTAYTTSSLSIDKNQLQKELMDARQAGNVRKENDLTARIKEYNKEISKYRTESSQSFAGSLGSLGASMVEFAPEVLSSAALALISAVAAPATGGTSTAATVTSGAKTASSFAKLLKFAQPIVQAGLVYNKSADIEMGGIYEELGNKYPSMDEQTKRDISTVGGRLSGAVEALGASLGFGSIATKYVYPAIAKKIVGKELTKDIAKSQIFERTFTEKLAGLAKDSLISGSEEAAEEVVQKAIGDTIDELAQRGEEVSYTSTLKGSIENLGTTASNLISGKATESDIEQLKTFFYVMSSSGLLSAGLGGAGQAISSSAGKFTAPKGEQKNFMQIAAEGEKNLNTAEQYMQSKTESKVNQLSHDAYKENSKILVQEGVAPENVYLDVDSALILAQQAETDDSLAIAVANLGLDEKIEKAQMGDGKVEIDFETADEIIFNTEDDTLYQKIKGDISFSKETMSKAESDNYIKEIFKQMPELQEELKDKQTIAGQVSEELKGNMEDNEAAANAGLAKLVLSSLAEATGADEKTIIQDLDLKIQADKRRKTAAKVARNMKPKKKLLGKDKLKGVKVKKKTVDLKTVEPNDIVAGQGVDYMKEEGDNVVLFEDKNGENIVVRGNEAVAAANLAQGETKADVTVVSAKDGYTIDDAQKMASEIDEDIIADTQDVERAKKDFIKEYGVTKELKNLYNKVFEPFYEEMKKIKRDPYGRDSVLSVARKVKEKLSLSQEEIDVLTEGDHLMDLYDDIDVVLEPFSGLSYEQKFFGTQDEKLYQIIKDSNDLAEENARLDDIYPEYKGETININGEEKTVYNSNGDKIAKSEEALRNFYKWFGDSKVVDEQGRPMVVYHGTNADFDTFNIDITTNGRASGNAFYFTKNRGRAKGYGENILSVYISAQNPFLLNDTPISKDLYISFAENFLGMTKDKAEESYKQAGKNIPSNVSFFNMLNNKNANKSAEFLKDQGFDGLFSNYNVYDLVLAFDPNQIKSTDNRGTYSLEDDNIYLQAPEASIAGFYDPKQTLIRLTKASNPTTFAHELMHFHFDMMSRAYQAGKLTEFWDKQFEKLLKSMGAKVEGRVITFESNEARINANEKLAEQFTTYLSEGKAPSKGLEAIFDMFRDMFMRAYRMIKGLNQVKLNKTVTDYFDKLFVKEQEATLLAQEEHYGAIERPSGITDVQWDNYLALTKRAHSHTVSSAFTETAKIAEKQATEEYQSRFKKNFQGFFEMLSDDIQFQAWEVAFNSKINPESLKGKLTEGRELKPIFTSKGGIDAEVLMNQGEFQTIDELVDFLNANKSTKTTAENMAKEQTDEWLKKEYPELERSDVEAASRNIATIKAQLQEAMMLRGISLDQFGLYYTNLIKTAEEAFNKMKAKGAANIESLMTQLNTLTERYRIAEMKGDRNEMGKLRYRAAVLNYTLMRAYTLRSMMKKFDRHFKKYKALTPSKSQLQKIEGSVWSIIHATLYNFGYTRRKPISNESVSARIDEYVNDQKSQTFLAKDLIENTEYFLDNDAGLTAKDMTVADFATLNGALRLLENVSQKSREATIAGKKQSIAEAVEEINAKLDEEGRERWEKDDAIKNFFLGKLAMKETLLSRIFPQKIFTAYVLPFMEGLTKKAQWISEKGKQLADIVDPILKRKDEMFTIDGNTFSLQTLMVIMLNSGNEHNRKCLVKTLNESKRYGEFTNESLQSLLDQMPKELRSVAQQVWDFFESNAKDFKDAQERIMGAELKMVEPSPVYFSDGEVLKGGYYPAGKKAIAVDTDFTDVSNMNQSKTFPIFGFQKERQLAVHGDLDLSTDTLETWLYQMSSMINVAEPYMNLYSLISNRDFANRLGDGGIRSLQQWMMLSIKPEAVSKGLAFLDSMASLGVLGWRPIKVFVQLSGILPAMKEVGATRVLNEFIPIAANPVSWFTTWGKAKNLSNYMNERFSNPENHLADIRRMGFLNGGKIKKGLEKANNIGMLAVAYGDCLASYATWNAQYKKSLENGATEAEAVLEADSMVRRLQGDTSAGSRPPLIQGNLRFLTKFASYFLGVNSLITSDVAYGKKANAIAVLAVAGILAPVMEACMSYMLEWEGADDEKRRRWAREGIRSAEDLLQKKAVENIGSSTGASLFPAYGFGSALGRAVVGGKVYPAEVTALTYAYNFINIGEDLDKYITAESNSDKEKASKKLFEHTLKTVGINANSVKETKTLLDKLLRRQ